ncbi:CU044_5270 family protein [Streptomyces sp. NPDC014861]|uniref:CU044_5270 family protein n=1 Tax=Streptomyces sp. NPDC014861 TaxID=3364923 RepID=UPI0036F82040
MNTPTGFKQRLGAELAVLERAKAERAAEAVSEPGTQGTARRALAWPGIRRTTFMGLAAGTVAVALIATTGGDAVRPGQVQALTVAQVLDSAAAHAQKRPDKQPRPRQWIYTNSVVCENGCEHVPFWVRYDGASSAFVDETVSTGDRQVVSVIGGLLAPPGRGVSRPQETREALSRLPTDPRELLERVSQDPVFRSKLEPSGAYVGPDREAHDGGTAKHPPVTTPGAQFARILNILQTAPDIPPRINAALYRALGLIPGTELVREPMRDAAGRSGITLAFSTGDDVRDRQYLFLDPDTYAYRGHRMDVRAWRDFSESYAVVATGVVDHPGQVPGGPAPDPSDVVERPSLLSLPRNPR